MNFKRKKSRRQVRCTLCTHHRWYGNRRGRQKGKEILDRAELVLELHYDQN